MSESVSIPLDFDTDESEVSLQFDSPFQPPTKRVPFKTYNKSAKKHRRSRTDPMRVDRLRDKRASDSPRYHSDPAAGDSTTSCKLIS